MIIDHVGIVTRSIEDTIRQWEVMFGYRQETGIVTNTLQKVRVVFLSKPGSVQVKLVEPVGPDSPVHAFAKRGGGLHHLCFKTTSVEGEVGRLESFGARVLASPQPGEAFENEAIAFVYAAGLNIELIDTDRRAQRLSP